MGRYLYNKLIQFMAIMVVMFLITSHSYADSYKTSDPSFSCPFGNYFFSEKEPDITNYDWEYINNLKGIDNFRKKIKNTEATAYKGVCVINSPVKTIFSIITDVKNHHKWVKFCKSSEMVSGTSHTNSTQYYQFDIPWPFSNRDMVINSTIDVNWKKGRVVITSVASDSSIIPENDEFIRVAESKQKWLLEQIAPDVTKVTFTSYTPLSVSDSALLKKIASTTIPFSTLEQLKILSGKKHKTESSGFIVKSDTDSSNKKGFKKRSYN